jgi:hypothetical protein
MKSIADAEFEYRTDIIRNKFNAKEERIFQSDMCYAFKEGVKFAQRWIPIKEELPEHSDEIIEGTNYDYTKNPVLIQTNNGKFTISKRSRFQKGEWSWIGSGTFNSSVTHWRHIELA